LVSVKLLRKVIETSLQVAQDEERLVDNGALDVGLVNQDLGDKPINKVAVSHGSALLHVEPLVVNHADEAGRIVLYIREVVADVADEAVSGLSGGGGGASCESREGSHEGKGERKDKDTDDDDDGVHWFIPMMNIQETPSSKTGKVAPHINPDNYLCKREKIAHLAMSHCSSLNRSA